MSNVAARIGQKLVERSLVTESELDGARVCAEERGLALDEALVALGLVTEDQAGTLLAEEQGVPYVFPYAATLDPELVQRFPAALLLRLEALPFALEDGSVVLATTRIPGEDDRQELEAACGSPVVFSLAARRRVRAVLEQALGAPRPAADPSGASGNAPGRSDDPAAVALLYGHLARALAEGATEVRFEPDPGGVAGGAPPRGTIRIRYRVAGRLEERAQAPIASHLPLVARARILAGALGGTSGPCDAARLKTAIGGRDVLLEVAILRARAGESVLVRMGAVAAGGADLRSLGCSPETDVRLRALLAAPRGIVIVAGAEPARSRRAALAVARAAGPATRAILALERDAIEPEPRFRQVAIEGSSADALAATRPWMADVVMIGEPLEAPADVDAALLSAESALVIAIAPDPDGASALAGLLERGARPSRLSRSLQAIVTAGEGGLEVLAPDGELRIAIERRAVTSTLSLTARGG